MKLSLTFREEKTEERDVEFPIYRKHDLMPDDYERVIYTRIEHLGEQEFRETSITIRENDWREKHKVEVEIEVDTSHGLSTGSGIDYTLGLGRYALTATQFNDAWERARKLLDEVKEPV